MRSPKVILIYSTIRLYNGNSAASSRMTKYAKALSRNNTVYLFNLLDRKNISESAVTEIEKNIFQVGKTKKQFNKLVKIFTYPFEILKFTIDLYSFSLKIKSNKVFLLYPNTNPMLDFISVIYLIFIKKEKVFLEINEVRKYDSTIHNKTFKESPLLYLRARYFYMKFIFSEKLSKYFAGLVCISTNIEKYFSKYNRNTTIIPILCDSWTNTNGNFRKYDCNEKFMICFTGSVIIFKENLDLFIDSLKILKKSFDNFEFHLYGNSSVREIARLEQLIDKNDLKENVFYKGFVNQKELPEIYRNYHLLVSPRGNNLQNVYGFSTKIAEYMTSGVPFLVTDVSDNALFIKDGYNGFIVQADNIKIMSDKLLQIIENYNSYLPQIILNSKETVKEKLLFKNYSDQLENFLC